MPEQKLTVEYILKAVQAIPDWAAYGAPLAFAAFVVTAWYRQGRELSIFTTIITIGITVAVCYGLLPTFLKIGAWISNFTGVAAAVFRALHNQSKT